MYIMITIAAGAKRYDLQTEENQKIADVLAIVENTLDSTIEAENIPFVKASNPQRVLSTQFTFARAGIISGEIITLF